VNGYAVVGAETGIFPGGHHRIVAIAVVQVAPDGTVDQETPSAIDA